MYIYIYINYKYLSHTMLLNLFLCINSPIHWISKPGRFGRPSRSLLRLGSSDRWQFGAAAGVPRALCSAAHGAWDLSSKNGDSSRDLTMKIGTEPSNMWIFNIQNWDVTWCNQQNIQKKMDLTSTSTDSTWLTHWILEMELEDSAWFSNPFGVSDVFLTFVQSGRWYGNFLLSSIFGIGNEPAAVWSSVAWNRAGTTSFVSQTATESWKQLGSCLLLFMIISLSLKSSEQAFLVLEHVHPSIRMVKSWFPNDFKVLMLDCLVVWNMFYFPIQLGMSWSQLTKSYFFRRGSNHQPVDIF